MPEVEERESAPLLLSGEKASGKPGVTKVISLVATAGGSSAQGEGQQQPSVWDTPTAVKLSPWGVTACMLLADMFGVGSLSLPSVFARLGWVFSFILMAVFSLGCGYLGVLFSKLGVAVPSAQAFDEIGAAALGKTGTRLVYSLVYTTIFIDPVVLQLTCVLALQRIVTSLSSVVAGIIVAVIMIPLAQIQNIHDAGSLSVVATVAMITAAGIALIKMLAMPGSKLSETTLLLPPGTGHVTVLTAIMNLVFAFGGQVNWMRYESAMKSRFEFKYAVEVADFCMTLCYILIASIGYWKLGRDFDFTKPVTSVLPQDTWAVLMNVALLIRCLVAYLLNLNIWTDMVIRVGRPWLGWEEERFSHGQKAMWACVSLLGLAFSFVVAWALPFFSTILALIGAIGDVAAPYTLPAIFALALLKDAPKWEKWMLKAIVPLSALLALAGVYAAIAEMVSLSEQE